MPDEICQTLNSRMGTGGGNVPLVWVIEDDCNPTEIQQCDYIGNRSIPDP